MPFSTQLQQQYVELIEEKLNHVRFDNPHDFDDFCISILSLTGTSPGLAPAHLPIAKKYQEDFDDLKELVEAGFELYATDKIIDKVNHVQVGTDSESPYVAIRAFIPAEEAKGIDDRKEIKVSRDEKLESAKNIEEAKSEFKRLMQEGIKKRILTFTAMDAVQKNEYIAKQEKKRTEATANRVEMDKRPPPSPDSPAHTVSEEEWLLQQQMAFQAEGEIPAVPSAGNIQGGHAVQGAGAAIVPPAPLPVGLPGESSVPMVGPLVSSPASSRFFHPALTAAFVESLVNLSADALYEQAKSSPTVATHILQSDVLRGTLLPAGDDSNQYSLRDIAESHPASAALILNSDVLRGTLLPAGNDSNQYSLREIALSHPASAALILNSDVLRGTLLPAGNADNQSSLCEIVESHPASAALILNSDVLRGELLSADSVFNRGYLFEIAKLHFDSATLILNSDVLRGTLLPANDLIGNATRLTLIMDHYEHSARITDLCSPFLPASLPMLTAAYVESLANLRASELYEQAKLSPAVAARILRSDVLRGTLLPAGNDSNQYSLRDIASSHPASAALILNSDVLRGTLLPAGNDSNQYSLRDIALSHPASAALILNSDVLRGTLLPAGDGGNQSTLCEIAESHPASAALILNSDVLRGTLLPAGNDSNQYSLCEIAKSHPASAALILNSDVLRGALLPAGNADNQSSLREIVESHPASAALILNSDVLRGELLSADSVFNRDFLFKIAKLHPASAALILTSAVLRGVLLPANDPIGNATRLTLIMDHYEHSEQITDLCSPFLLAAPAEEGEIPAVPSAGNIQGGHAVQGAGAAIVPPAPLPVGLPGESSVPMVGSLVSSPASSRFSHPALTAAFVESLVNLSADALYEQAKLSPAVATHILQSDVLRGTLLPAGSDFNNQYYLLDIAESHPASAALILNSAVLRGTLLPAGNNLNQFCLRLIALSHPASAALILNSDVLRGELLPTDSVFDRDFLCKIAKSHPASAALILNSDVLRGTLLSADDSFNNCFLCIIAKSHPASAALILNSDVLRGALLPAGNADNQSSLREIVESHPASAALILNSDVLRGELLSADSVFNRDFLFKIAKLHPASAALILTSAVLRGVLLPANDPIGNATRLTRLMGHYENSEAITNLCNPFLPAAPAEGGEIPAVPSAGNIQGGHAVQGAGAAVVPPPPLPVGLPGESSVPMVGSLVSSPASPSFFHSAPLPILTAAYVESLANLSADDLSHRAKLSPAIAAHILQSDVLRGRLLPAGNSLNEHYLFEIAKSHFDSATLILTSNILQGALLPANDPIGNAARLTLIMAHYEHSEAITGLCNPFLPAAPSGGLPA